MLRDGVRLQRLAGRSALLALTASLLLAASSAAASSVAVFPLSGSRLASPHTTISFRGVSASNLGAITVTGSQSGVHTGHVAGHSDGNGVSFIADKAFTPNETVTVGTGLNIIGGSHGTYHFSIVNQAGHLPNRPFAPLARVHGDVMWFHSRKDIEPAAISIKRRSSRTAPGDIFIGPQDGPVQNGPAILDASGNLVWFKAVPKYNFATDVRVQRLDGQPVLTWWQGYFGAGVGSGVGVINDTHYHVLTVVHGGNYIPFDLHEFKITPQGTALITGVYPVYSDASSIHHTRHAIVFDGVVQEIDIKTGLVEYEWHSLDHVPLSDSYRAFPNSNGAPFDYFHINSVDQDTDGNLIVSGRSTSAVYKIDRRSGAIIWRLGGRHSTFKAGSGASMAFQHDVRVQAAGDSRITAFDNGAGLYNVHSQSRGVILHLDLKHKTVSKLGEFDHSPRLLSGFEGNVQPLSNGDSFIGWGEQPYFSEFNFRGQLLFDARFVDANTSYRAYRFPWVGTPQTLPAVAASTSGGRTTVYVSWNGATQVASWRVLAGASPTTLASAGSARRSGFETAIRVAGSKDVAVQALDGRGNVLAQSPTVQPR
jgi:Arylsulfotransferase (ASST)